MDVEINFGERYYDKTDSQVVGGVIAFGLFILLVGYFFAVFTTLPGIVLFSGFVAFFIIYGYFGFCFWQSRFDILKIKKIKDTKNKEEFMRALLGPRTNVIIVVIIAAFMSSSILVTAI